MVKLLLANDEFGMGGIQRVSSTIANSLYKDGVDVSVYCPLYNNSVYYKIEAPIKSCRRLPFFVGKALTAISMFSHGVFPGRIQFELIDFLSRNPVDTLLLNPYYFSATKYIKKKFPSKKVYLWMHNSFDVYTDSKHYFTDTQALFDAVRMADGIVCLESYSAQKWRQYNDNVTVIHNPLTIDAKDRCCDLSSHTIAFASRLVMKQKGLDYLIQIAKKIPDDWKIRVAGSGPDESKLRELIRDEGVDSRVELVGPLQGKDLIQHYASSSIFLMTSRWEGFSLVTTEAMSLGLPVVAFNLPAMQEVTGHGEYAVLAKDGDVDDFSAKLNVLIKSQEMRERYSKLSLERAQAFALSKITADWRRYLGL